MKHTTELVTKIGDEPRGVRYDVLIPMLLNELQKQDRENAEQHEQIQMLTKRLARLEAGRTT